MKPFYVYMLECSDRSFYVGHTDDLQTRLAQHESGALGGHTSTRRPVRLVWFEEQPTRDEALRSELQLKGWSRAKKRALVAGDWATIKRLARGPDWSSVKVERGAASSFDSGPACGGPYAQDERGGIAPRATREAVHPERGDRLASSFDSGPACGGPYAQDERGEGSRLVPRERRFTPSVATAWPRPSTPGPPVAGPTLRTSGGDPPGFPKKSVRPERSGRAAAAESKGGGQPDA